MVGRRTVLRGSLIAILFAAGGLAASAAPVLADCLGNDPIAAAKTFYQKHADFYYADPSKFQGDVAPRLMNALAMNFDCSDGQICALDSDPWVDAQDGDVAEPITYQLGDHSDSQASVTMHYTFTLADNPSQPQQVTLKLQRADQCWQVADMITPRGDSLTEEIETWFKTYGKDGTAPAN